MSKKEAVLFALVLLGLSLSLGSLISGPAKAQTQVVPEYAAAHWGSIALPANTATKVPSQSLFGRSSIAIENRDSASIYCGWGPGVTSGNGWEITSSDTFTVDVSYTDKTNTQMYCISVAGQTSPNDVRWIEIR